MVDVADEFLELKRKQAKREKSKIVMLNNYAYRQTMSNGSLMVSVLPL